MVETGSDEEQWKRFDASMRVLDGKVPYVLALGNHDYGKAADTKGTTLFDRYFPAERFAKLPHLATSAGDVGNSYRTFRVGGRDWLIVTLPFVLSDAQLAGAERVVAQHPEHRGGRAHHSYLTTRAATRAASGSGKPWSSGTPTSHSSSVGTCPRCIL